MSSAIQVTSVNYPDSDGKPMGETDEHRDEMIRQLELLRRFFAGQQVYVSGNLLLYYEQGNPKKFVVPDLFVVKGTDPGKRRTFKLWVERQVPQVIIETTSRKTKKQDSRIKPELYRQLSIPEYFLFDPTEDYLDPPLQGYRLAEGRYVRLAADPDGGLLCEQLGLRLQPVRRQLMFFRLDTGDRLLTAEESRQAEADARQLEAEARRVAEAEVARLRGELRRLRGD